MQNKKKACVGYNIEELYYACRPGGALTQNFGRYVPRQSEKWGAQERGRV